MKKQIVITLAAMALLVSACGHDASFKTSGVPTAPEVTQDSPLPPAADQTAEEKALAIVSDDANVKTDKGTELSNILAEEIKGVSLTIAQTQGEKDDGRPVKVTTAKLTIASMKKNDCPVEDKALNSFKLADASKDFIHINNGGRFRCLEEACENILLIIENSRYVQMLQENGKKKSEYQRGDMSILMKKASDGIYKPVATESRDFAQLQDAKMGELNCIDEISTIIFEKAKREKEEQRLAELNRNSVGRGQPTPVLSVSDRVRAYQQAQIAAATKKREELNRNMVGRGGQKATAAGETTEVIIPIPAE
jgi:hypothetical protein